MNEGFDYKAVADAAARVAIELWEKKQKAVGVRHFGLKAIAAAVAKTAYVLKHHCPLRHEDQREDHDWWNIWDHFKQAKGAGVGVAPKKARAAKLPTSIEGMTTDGALDVGRAVAEHYKLGVSQQSIAPAIGIESAKWSFLVFDKNTPAPRNKGEQQLVLANFSAHLHSMAPWASVRAAYNGGEPVVERFPSGMVIKTTRAVAEASIAASAQREQERESLRYELGRPPQGYSIAVWHAYLASIYEKRQNMDPYELAQKRFDIEAGRIEIPQRLTAFLRHSKPVHAYRFDRRGDR